MSNTFHAIILAAGSGRRMRPISNERHKTLIEINGRSILSSMIDKLLRNGITEITLVLGYQFEKVKDHVKEIFPGSSFNFVINERFAQTNNLVSLAMAMESIKVKSDVIIIEADLIYDENVIKRLIESKYKNVALVDHFNTGMDGTVVTVSDNVITGLIPPHLQDEHFNFSDKFKTLNIYKFSKEFAFGTFKDLLSYFIHSIKDSYYELIIGIIIYLRSETIHAEILEGEKWAEMDDPNDLSVARFIFEENQKAFLDNAYGGFWNYPVIDFCYLRNMYFPPASFKSELKNNLDKTLFEYGSTQKILNRKMSYYLECDEENVVCLNGTSQFFPFIRGYLKQKTILIPYPTFGEYPRTFPSAKHYPDTIGIDFRSLSEKNEEVIVFVNPNNPSGTTLATKDIYEFSETRSDKMIIVDESFIDFSSEQSIIDLLMKNPLDNVVVIKSLSKAMGIAGLRIGFCYTTNQALKGSLHQYLPIWNMNTIAENFLEIILKYKPQFRKSLELVKSDREEFFKSLKTVSFIKELYPSGGNYLLAKTDLSGKEEQQLFESLLSQHRIYLKSVKEKFNDGKSWIRFAVHQPIQNDHLVGLLKEFRF